MANPRRYIYIGGVVIIAFGCIALIFGILPNIISACFIGFGALVNLTQLLYPVPLINKKSPQPSIINQPKFPQKNGRRRLLSTPVEK